MAAAIIVDRDLNSATIKWTAHRQHSKKSIQLVGLLHEILSVRGRKWIMLPLTSTKDLVVNWKGGPLLDQRTSQAVQQRWSGI